MTIFSLSSLCAIKRINTNIPKEEKRGNYAKNKDEIHRGWETRFLAQTFELFPILFTHCKC